MIRPLFASEDLILNKINHRPQYFHNIAMEEIKLWIKLVDIVCLEILAIYFTKERTKLFELLWRVFMEWNYSKQIVICLHYCSNNKLKMVKEIFSEWIKGINQTNRKLCLKYFFSATSSSWSAIVPYLVCLLACLSPYFFLADL